MLTLSVVALAGCYQRVTVGDANEGGLSIPESSITGPTIDGGGMPVTGFACSVVPPDNSAALCSWAGPAAILCARGNSQGIADTCTPGPVASPAMIDPGPPGAGGGQWSITLEDGTGPIAGPVAVTLAS